MPQGPLRIQWIYQNAPRRNWFQLVLGVLALLMFFTVGVWLLMIVATLLVLLLPYFWWKKRKLMAKMAQMQQEFTASAAGFPPHDASHSAHGRAATGRVFEGEIIEGEIIDQAQASSNSKRVD